MALQQGQLSPLAQQQTLRYAQMPQIVPGMGVAPASMVAGVPPMMAAQYGYAQLLHGQGSRKNATRESTQQLKVWLKEHQKNPYPTKGEKIMLALMSGMSLTQVSTWFANARRRLKKENKWSPDGSCDDSENVSDSGASEETHGVEQRVPQLPLNDESGYSSSDRDSGSPPVTSGLSTMGYPMHPGVMSYLPTTLQSSKSESSLQMPRYMPRLTASPTNQTAKRQARSLWSIVDIAGEASSTDAESESNIDVTE